ncbi:MAG: hypothetical protein ACQEWU_03050 [Bacillota bacterium]|uniref:hypothetical protein n=1 Tax=unclassified Virgibacillus TaxID=2620237 RepID=UPI001D166453|nr:MULTISPECIES: hypothetical protein [unclassified Virgibacillus]MCC2251463.1 hypothetical protein [Virgibacillus sp. AGTR]MDY7044862.1 hypothetical protein [Virgibacillus sp. M23]
MITKNRFFYTTGYISVAMGLFSLLVINISILYNNFFFLYFIPQGIGILTGIVGSFDKQSKVYGLWGIALNASTLLYILVVMILGTTINPQP